MTTLVAPEIARRGRLLDQLFEARLITFVTPGTLRPDGPNWRGTFNLAVLPRLAADCYDERTNPAGHFMCALPSPFHTDIQNRREYRSLNGAFGDESVHLSIDETTGEFCADLDEFAFGEDIYRDVGHGVEVVRNDGPKLLAKIGGWFKRIVVRRPPANPSPRKTIVDIERERRRV